MLAFAHIPTGATVNTGFNIDEVNSRFVEPTGALAAIGADIGTGGLHLKTRFRLSHVRGPLQSFDDVLSSATRVRSRSVPRQHLLIDLSRQEPRSIYLHPR